MLTFNFPLYFLYIKKENRIEIKTKLYDNDDEIKVSPNIVPRASSVPETEPISKIATINITSSGNDVNRGEIIVPAKFFEKLNLKLMYSKAFTNNSDAMNTITMLNIRSNSIKLR